MIEENVRYMFNEHIHRVRLTEDVLSKSYVFDNQIETAKEIIFNFYTKNNKNRWCLLFAEMQSGKSGTFFSVPYIVSRNKILVDKLKIDMINDEINVFLLTGMNEKELISQFEKDIISFTGMDISKNVLHNSEMRKFLSKEESCWSISDSMLINRMRKNSLILIDESHYGSDRNQILDKFLRKIIKINPNGDNVPLSENNIYVVSISATPMAEFINANISDFKKKIIPLKNSDGYYGIEEMFKNKKIFNSFDLKDDTSVDRFLDTIINLNKNGYILVRCSKKEQDRILKRIGERRINSLSKPIHYDQYCKSTILDNMGINEILHQYPSMKTIIFLKGLLRAGKRVDTNNVIMVHDTSISNVDTTVQSLLGRCCGYGKNKNIDIYCDRVSAEKYKKWVENEFKLDFVPDKSKNVLKRGKSNFHLKKIEILKYDLDPTLQNLYNKKIRTKKERKLIIRNYLKELYKDSDYYVGSFYNKSNSSVIESYNSKDGYLCIGDMDKEFNKDLNPVGKLVITTLIDESKSKIEFSIGLISEQEVATNDKTMYHQDNFLEI